MNNTSVIILAAGNAVRFGGKRKQLLPIGTTSILKRVVDQSKENCCCPTVIAADEEIISASLSYGAMVYLPYDRRTVCDTAISTWELWNDRTIILLGDVIYSDDTVNKIFSYSGDFTVFGNTWEIFAVSFARNRIGEVCNSLTEGSKHRLGKLRYMYKHMERLPLDSSEIEGSPPGNNFVYIRDWTKDVDMEVEYTDAMSQIVERGLLDV